MPSTTILPTDQAKKEIWDAYHARRPVRVPLRWNTNPRVILLNPDLNPEGYSFEQYSHDPKVMLTVQARFWEYQSKQINQRCDSPTALPEEWTFYLDTQNITDGAYFGDPVVYAPWQCPATHNRRTAEDIDDFLKMDYSKPLENPWLKERLEFHRKLTREAEGFTYLGRKGKVMPFINLTEGPLTDAVTLFGDSVLLLLATEPEKCRRLFRFIVEAIIERRRAQHAYFNIEPDAKNLAMADDSVQMIGVEMVEEVVLPSHRIWYEQYGEEFYRNATKFMHLCGDSTRHFATICRLLGVSSFDTGYPVDHGALRRTLGPEVEISGGPRAGLMTNGTPEECAREARKILESGVKEGGRFILQEGNNLPPCTPLENMAAVYETVLEYGNY